MHDQLLYTIIQYDGHGNVKPIVYWDRFKTTVAQRIEMYTNRLINTVLPTAPWVRLIKILLNMIPVNSLINAPSLSSRYAAIMMDVVMRIDDYLAPNYSIKTFSNLFVADNNASVQEYLIPCRSETPMLDLPLDSEIKYWESIHPIRILYSDTLELCGNNYHGDFNYRYEPPKQLIAMLDTPSLIFKYIAYCEYQLKHNAAISKTEFIQHHLIQNLYYDIFNCWIFQLLNSFVGDMDKNNPEDLYDQLIVHPNIVTPIMTQQATEDLTKYWVNLSTMRYNLNDFMIADWFSDGWMPSGHNLKDMVHQLHYYIKMPFLRQNAYIRFMIDFPIVRLIIKVNNLLNGNINRKMNKELNIILSRFKMTNVLINCQNNSLRAKLARQLDDAIAISRRDNNSPKEAEPRTIEF